MKIVGKIVGNRVEINIAIVIVYNLDEVIEKIKMGKNISKITVKEVIEKKH